MAKKHKGAKKASRYKSLVIPCLTVFITSFCIMVVELVAGRLIARHLGSSLYTWTAVIGVVLGFDSCTDGFVDPGGCALVGGLFFGAAGALLGALLGANVKTERWVSVSLDALRVSVGPQRDGRLGLGMSVKF